MYAHPYLCTELARDCQREMLADAASYRRVRQVRGRPSLTDLTLLPVALIWPYVPGYLRNVGSRPRADLLILVADPAGSLPLAPSELASQEIATNRTCASVSPRAACAPVRTEGQQ